MASSPGITFAAPAPVSEYVTASALVVEYVASMPAPEDEESPALVAAKRQLVDLKVRGLGEGDPEYDYRCLAARTSRRTDWGTGVRTGGMRECWVQPVWGELDGNLDADPRTLPVLLAQKPEVIGRANPSGGASLDSHSFA